MKEGARGTPCRVCPSGGVVSVEHLEGQTQVKHRYVCECCGHRWEVNEWKTDPLPPDDGWETDAEYITRLETYYGYPPGGLKSMIGGKSGDDLNRYTHLNGLSPRKRTVRDTPLMGTKINSSFGVSVVLDPVVKLGPICPRINELLSGISEIRAEINSQLSHGQAQQYPTEAEPKCPGINEFPDGISERMARLEQAYLDWDVRYRRACRRFLYGE